MNNASKINGLIVSDFTNATLMVDRTVQLSALRAKVWEVLLNPEIAGDWLPSVKKVLSTDVSNADALGVGTVRTVLYGIKEPIIEKIVYVEENTVLAYQVAFPSMVKDHLTVIELVECGVDQTTVRIRAFFTPTDVTGCLMKYGVYSMIIKSALKSLQNICAESKVNP